MADLTEFIGHYASARYGSALERVDAGCIKLIDGTEIFTASLFAELSTLPPEEWHTVVDEWFSMLDLIRARIAGTG